MALLHGLNFWKLCFFLSVHMCLFNTCMCRTPPAKYNELLDTDGGFTINVYVADGVNNSMALNDYLREGFTRASGALWRGTHSTFYFKHINIYVPSEWNINQEPVNDIPECQEFSYIIDKPNPIYGNTPYTKDSGKCGKRGDYIHLPDAFFQEFLTDPNASVSKWGKLQNVLVHEFAHLRWGVGEEYARPGMDKQYYIDATGRVRPNVCSKYIRGAWYKNGSECDMSSNTSNCIFIPNITYDYNIEMASLMSYNQIELNELFCDSEAGNNERKKHNYEAQTQHNKMCKGKSVMEVIRASEDWQKTHPRARKKRTVPDYEDCDTHRCFTWKIFVSKHAVGAIKQDNISELCECLRACERKHECTSIDFNKNTMRCWLHSRVITAFRNNTLINHYRLSRTCNRTETHQITAAVKEEESTTQFPVTMSTDTSASTTSTTDSSTFTTSFASTASTSPSASTASSTSATSSSSTPSTPSVNFYVRKPPKRKVVVMIEAPKKKPANSAVEDDIVNTIVKHIREINRLANINENEFYKHLSVLHYGEKKIIQRYPNNDADIMTQIGSIIVNSSREQGEPTDHVNGEDDMDIKTECDAMKTNHSKDDSAVLVLFTNGEHLESCNITANAVELCIAYKATFGKIKNVLGCRQVMQLNSRKSFEIQTIPYPSCNIIKNTTNPILLFKASEREDKTHEASVFIERNFEKSYVTFNHVRNESDSVLVELKYKANKTRIDPIDINIYPDDSDDLDEFKYIWTVDIPSGFMNGMVTVTISSNDSFKSSIEFIGKPSANSDSEPIILTSSLSIQTFNYSDQNLNELLVKAALTKGGYPVIKANVLANIFQNGILFDNMVLWDNGTGVDIEKEDGVYTNQMVKFPGNGNITIDISVDNSNELTKAEVKTYRKSGAIDFTSLYQVAEPVIEEVDPFQRYSPSIIIEVVNLPENGTDLYPPARVTDLFVIDIIQQRRIATIRFTVTGDDITQGKASRVEVRSGKSTDELLQNFTAATLIANITSLELPGEVMVANLTFQGTEAEYYVVALKVIDDAGKESDVSNTASFYFENIAQIVTGNSQFTTTTAFTEVKSTQLSRAISVEGSLDIDTLLKIVIPIVVGLVILTAVGAIICYCVYKKRHTNKAPPPPTISDIINPYYNTPPPRTTEPDSMGDNPENCLPATEHGFIRDNPNNHHVISMAPAIYDCTDRSNMNSKPVRDSGLYTTTIQPIDPMPMIPHSALHENPAQYKPNDIPPLPPKQCPPAIPEKKHKKNNFDKIVLNARDKLKPVERKRIIHQATIPEDGDSDDIYDDTSAPEMRQKHENLSMNDKNRNSTTSTVFGDAMSIPMHDKRNIAGIQMGGTELPLPAACKRPKHDTKDPEPYHQTFAGKSALPKDDQPSPFARSSVYNDVDDGQINMFNFDRDLPTFNGKMKETYMFGARMQPGGFGHMRSPNATDDQKRGFRF